VKGSLALAVGIVLVGWWLGRGGGETLERLREDRRVLEGEARRLGVVVVGQEARDPRVGEREDVGRAGRELLGPLVALVREIKALEELGETPKEELQERIMGLVGRVLELQPAELEALIEELRATDELDDEARREVIGFCLMMLAGEHPAMALDLYVESAEALGWSGEGKGLATQALKRLAGRDPEAAVRWWREHGERHPELIDDEVRLAIVEGAARRDFGRALELVDELGFEEERVRAFRELAAGADAAGCRELLRRLRGEADEAQRKGVVEGLARNLVEAGPAGADEWLGSVDLYQSELVGIVADIRPWDEVGDSGAWLEWMEDKLPRNRLEPKVESIVGHWTRQDYRGAGEWLAGLPEGPLRDGAAARYAREVAPYDPAAAAEWAATLPRGEARRELARRVHEAWREEDPGAAAGFARREGIEE